MSSVGLVAVDSAADDADVIAMTKILRDMSVKTATTKSPDSPLGSQKKVSAPQLAETSAQSAPIKAAATIVHLTDDSAAAPRTEMTMERAGPPHSPASASDCSSTSSSAIALASVVADPWEAQQLDSGLTVASP